VRWYELRGLAGDASIFQQGTFAPADGVHRWLGSVAMDRDGNIAVGYSVSNGTSVNPGIRYAGRLAGDPAGLLAQGEAVMMAGGGSQTDAASRWGDYAAMSVDPEDDCTFWFTSEYYPATSPRGWHTRIGHFSFPTCDVPPEPTVSVSDAKVTEGGDLEFTVSLSAAPATTVTVDHATQDGTAEAGADFTAVSEHVEFAPGDPTSQVVVVHTQGDSAFEGPESAFLNLTDVTPGAVLADPQGLGVIEDDDPEPPTCPGFAGDPRNQVVGTPGADHLVGTPGADVICGLGGDDEIEGRGGNDLLIGGGGVDSLLGGGGADTLRGGLGGDDLFGGIGADELQGQAGADTLKGQDGADDLFGGGAADILNGGRGNDDLNGGYGVDTCLQGAGTGSRISCER
jgi:Ca2+-binding RTX toxin-like protein